MKPWIVGLLTASAGAVVGAVAALSQRGRGLGEIRNRRDVHPTIAGDVDKYEARARAAGARGELDYIGAGGEGVVFCDTRGKAYKVGRGTRGDQGMRDEAEWLAMAAQIPNIKQHVPKFFSYDADNDVIVRECLVPKEQREYRRKPKKLWELHHRVAGVMATYGYGRPEFKDDSWVLTKRGPVLVDAGFAIRSGHPLVRDVLDVVNGRKKLKPIDIKQLSWDLKHERGKTIPAPVANKLLKRLQAIEPGVELDGLSDGLAEITPAQRKIAKGYLTKARHALDALDAKTNEVDSSIKSLRSLTTKTRQVLAKARAPIDDAEWSDDEDAADLQARLEDVTGPSEDDIDGVSQMFDDDWRYNLKRFRAAIEAAEDD